MARNNVKKFRKQRGLTQQALASLAGTSQQQIQRIESGTQLTRLELAAAIARALDVTLKDLFPEAQLPFAALKRRGEGALVDKKLQARFAKAGIDTDDVARTLRIQLTNGYRRDLQIAGDAHSQLWRALQDSDCRFVIFDSGDKRVALNAQHLSWWQFRFDVSYIAAAASEEQIEEAPLEFWTEASAEPEEIEVEQDTLEFGDGDDDAAPLQGLLFDLEMSDEADIRCIWSMDGDATFLRLGNISLMTIPLEYVEPRLWAAMDDDSNENDSRVSS